MAGFLALSEKSAFPTKINVQISLTKVKATSSITMFKVQCSKSSVSGFVGLSIMEITVAGTAQDLHLIPFSCAGETPGTSPYRLQK